MYIRLGNHLILHKKKEVFSYEIIINLLGDISKVLKSCKIMTIYENSVRH